MAASNWCILKIHNAVEYEVLNVSAVTKCFSEAILLMKTEWPLFPKPEGIPSEYSQLDLPG